MKNKHLVFFSTAFILVVLLSAITPSTCANPSIIIADYNVYPEVLMPGDSGILTLTITNAETLSTWNENLDSTTTIQKTIGTSIKKIWVLPAEDGTNHYIKATSSYSDVGYLAPGASFTIKFKIIADKNISEGAYFPKVCINVDDGEDVNFPVLVKVSNASVNLISTNVPSKISMSGSTEVTLSAINNRDAPVEGVTISPKKVNGIEFTPGSIFIGTLNPDISQDVSFSLKPTGTGVKNLSFEINYKNGDNIHNDTLTMPIETIETLDVAPVLYNVPSSIEKGKSTRISIEVFNAKTESITGVIVTPITDAIVVPSQYFIGAMDPDDVFSASFDLYTEDIDYGNHTIEFKVSFKQGNDYYETLTTNSSFKVVAAKQNNGNENIGIITGITAAVIVTVALTLFIVFKKRRNAK